MESPEHNSVNDFTEDLLIHILSFLPTIDAIKASLISRRWRNIWSLIPSLNFPYDIFQPSESPDDTSRRFSNFVDRTLILRHPHSLTLQTFRLQFYFTHHKHISLVESWIQYAINHHVVELDMDFFINESFHMNDYEENEFPLDFYLFHNSQIRVLKLSLCNLSLDYFSGVKFDSIRYLFLDQVGVMDDMVSNLLMFCPNIESLSLEYCFGMENVKIHGLKIKQLFLKHFAHYPHSPSSLEINCPNLLLLKIFEFEVDNYSLKNSSMLVEASVYFGPSLKHYVYWSKVMKLLGHVQKLNVQNWWFKIKEQKELSPSFKFENLLCLDLKTGYSKYDLLGIAALLELCPKLDTLFLNYLYTPEDEEIIYEDLWSKPINLSLSLPSLRRVAFLSFIVGKENQHFFLDLLIEHGVVCEEFVLFCIEEGERIYPPKIFVRNPNEAAEDGSKQWSRKEKRGTKPKRRLDSRVYRKMLKKKAHATGIDKGIFHTCNWW